MAPIVLYDACVLYPAPLRDLLMRLALTDLFQARWTDQIHDEWTRNVLANRPELTAESLARCRRLMDEHVPDCLVTGYESLIPTLSLPDPDDRHVLAQPRGSATPDSNSAAVASTKDRGSFALICNAPLNAQGWCISGPSSQSSHSLDVPDGNNREVPVNRRPSIDSQLGVKAATQNAVAVVQMTTVTSGISDSPNRNASPSRLTSAMAQNSKKTSVATMRFARPAARANAQGVRAGIVSC